MNRFFWLVRREVWEHKAIWVAPLVVIGCVGLLLLTGRVEIGSINFDHTPLAGLATPEQRITLLMYAYSALALVVDMVMGVIVFFYAIDALYADRRDRSVLFWKSLPMSDAESVLSKFAVAAVAIPLVGLAATVATQLLVATGESAKLALAGEAAGFLWEPRALLGSIGIAIVWCITAILWYAPVVGYLMLASAWAPRSPFLWAVLPPVGLWVIESVVLGSERVGDFITERLFVLPYLIRLHGNEPGHKEPVNDAEKIEHLANIDLYGLIGDFYRTPDLWLGVVVAGLLLAAAIWVRRYRDETS